ncbi:peptidoglycan editing factor PgeF [Oceanicaulis sp. UBA2681]|uniref:peptidoglycan editing factor PgeF n=1 Tax=Oceanicaulis sp. UBA2681 TaxID=1947007 RepID=UPI000EB8D9D2|nr:peptidoglycan editing factor PgeF [Oceanicaulis sp. UBA2681]HCR66512.1 peptidoglycan editing factor PgeF [Oceanicaulis sp.]
MLDILRADGFGDDRIAHGFTTRTGGTSTGPYASLNLSWSRGDDKAAVEANRARVSQAFGDARLVFANQVHGATVLKVDAAPEDWSAGEGDALITNQPGLALCAQTADCTPVLLYDPENAAIAAIHSGWRGVIAEVIPAAINALNKAYGSRPEALQAVIGPAVAPENYRVGPEVLEQFEVLFGPLDDGLALPRDSEGGAGLNVSEGARRQLLRAGVSEDAIRWLQACTFADADRFFSCRRAARDGHAGHFGGQCGVIMLTA